MGEPSPKKLKLWDNSRELNLAGCSNSNLTFISSNEVFQSPITTPMLFPENWELVFRGMHLKDFQSVINTCPEWNHLLGSRKTTALFPMILPILMENDYLTANSILNCRQVNKQAKVAIDETIQQETSGPTPSFKLEMKRRWKESRTTGIESLVGVHYDFEDDGDVELERFMRHVETKPIPSSNPFLSRQVSIGIGYVLEEDVANWKLSFDTLLSRYGHHLWRLTSYMCTWTLGETVSTLLELLHKMPNLKVMKMIGCIYMREEVERIRSITFPTLNYLESLDLEDFMSRDLDSEEPIVMPFLQNYGEQLKIFRCRGELLGRPGLGAEFLNERLQNVKQVCVSQVTSDSLQKLCQLTWPVEHLQLFECSIVDGGYAFIQSVNDVMSQFSNSLVEADLFVKLRRNFDVPNIEELPSSELQMMPKLRILRCLINNVGEVWFWRLLKLRCGELRELHLCTDDAILQTQVDVAKQGFEMMPKLERIVFSREFKNHRKQKSRIITREMHLQQMEN